MTSATTAGLFHVHPDGSKGPCDCFESMSASTFLERNHDMTDDKTTTTTETTPKPVPPPEPETTTTTTTEPADKDDEDA